MAFFYFTLKGISEMETDPEPTPTDDGQTPPASPPEPTPPADGQTTEEIKAELERVRKALKDANKEAAERRKKLEAFEAAEAANAEKELSESQRLQKKLDEAEATRVALENKLRANTINSAALAHASQLGFDNPADALALTDLSTVEITEDGTVTGFEKALEALAKSNRLKMKAPAGAGIGTPRGGLSPINGQGRAEQTPVKKVRL